MINEYLTFECSSTCLLLATQNARPQLCMHCMQVLQTMNDNIEAVDELSANGYQRLRSAFGLNYLLLNPVMPMDHDAGPMEPSTFNVCWDDMDEADEKDATVAVPSAGHGLRIQVLRLQLQGGNAIKRLMNKWGKTRKTTEDPERYAVLVGVPALGLSTNWSCDRKGQPLQDNPGKGNLLVSQEAQQGGEMKVEVHSARGTIATGAINCKILFQLGQQTKALQLNEYGMPADRGGLMGMHDGHNGVVTDVKLVAADSHVVVGNLSFSVQRYQRHAGEAVLVAGNAQRPRHQGHKAHGKPGAVQPHSLAQQTMQLNINNVYDELHKAAVKASGCNNRQPMMNGSWQSLLINFKLKFGVRDNYALLAHLR